MALALLDPSFERVAVLDVLHLLVSTRSDARVRLAVAVSSSHIPNVTISFLVLAVILLFQSLLDELVFKYSSHLVALRVSRLWLSVLLDSKSIRNFLRVQCVLRLAILDRSLPPL